MNQKHKSLLQSCLSLMMRPVADFCLARGVRFQDFVEVSKQSFVRASQRQLASQGKKVSHSRVSAMTGLQRPEVRRLLSNRIKTDPKDIVTRLIGQWERDKRFLDARGKPRMLSTDGASSEFVKLVRLVSKDLNPHTVRFELERLQLIEIKNDRARLVRPEYIAHGDPLKALQFAAEDVSDLLTAVESNAFLSADTPNLHARTQYDNIPDRHLPFIKESLLNLGQQFHARARALLSKFDRDVTPSLQAAEGRNRVVVGTFSRAHEYEEEGEV